MKKNNILIVINCVIYIILALSITVRSWYLFADLLFALSMYIFLKIELTKKNKYLVRISFGAIVSIPFISLLVTNKMAEYIENGYYIFAYFLIFLIGALIGIYKECKLYGYIK